MVERTISETETNLLYKAAEAIDRASRRIKELEAEVCNLRAEIQRQQTCCTCK